MNIDWRELHDLIRSHERFVLTSHVRPDADAIGSELGVLRMLQALGKQVRIINPSATPDHLKFLDPEGCICKLGDGVTADEARDTEVHLILDTSAWQQLGDVRKVLESTPARKVVIDHHLSSDNLEALEFKDVSAAATGVLVAELAESLGVTLTTPMAMPMFCAIATDTGWFRFPNTDARTLRVAARLIDCDVQPHLLYRELYERSSLARLKLHGRVLDRVQLECDGRLAHTFVRLKDFVETGSHPSDTEDLVNACLTIEGTECAFIIVEQKSRQMKVSLRSRSELDVAQVAETFGGGGHRQASGAMVPGPFATAQQRVLEALKSMLAANPSRYEAEGVASASGG